MRKLRVAIIGYGGIARAHNTAYANLSGEGFPLELVAVCDRDASRITAKLNFNLGGVDTPLPETVHIYSDIDELIAKEDFDVADVCLPTFLHKDVSVKLLLAGKHTLCEKPMALSSVDCAEMISAANKSGKRLMIAQVLRFDRAYVYLKEIVDGGSLGSLDNIYMERHSVYPGWGASFADNSVTGGCALDTHIHDVDMARYLLGEPDSVFATEFNNPPSYQAVTTTLRFGGSTAVINCSWDASYVKPFTFGFKARFEKGTVTCEDGVVRLTKLGEAPSPVKLPETDGVTEEIRHFLTLVLNGGENSKNPPKSSAASVALVEKIRESSTSARVIALK